MAKLPDDPMTMPASEDEFRLIADSAPVLIWVARPDGKRSFVNRAYLEFTGLSFHHACELDWRAAIHPDDAAQLILPEAATAAPPEQPAIEGRFRRADGEWRWLKSVSRPRYDRDGRHIGFIGVAHDVTDTKQAEQALREREAQYSAFINQATAGFAQVALDGRFTLVNDRFCEIAGWSREELLARTMQSITHVDDRDRNLPLFQRAVAVGLPYEHEKRYIRRDGEIVWVNNSVSVIRRPDGEPYGVLAVTIDVTQRRQAEDALRRSAESMRLAIEDAGMATWELDLETLTGEWSPNRFDLLGLPRTPDCRGSAQQWLALVDPADRAPVEAAMTRCFREGVPYTVDYRIRRADTGEVRWLQSHGTRAVDDDGRPSRFVGVSFDMTERARAEEELRESEKRHRTIFEEANDFIITTDLEQRITSVNPAVLAALDYDQADVLGRSIADFLDADQYDVARAALVRKLIEGGTTRLMLRVRARDGSARMWEINSRLTSDAEGTPTGLHAIARDMTEAMRADAHLRLLIDELNHRVKNTLAIVQGIVQQTFRPGVDSAVARAAFEGRLAALSEAHNLLTREHWGAVSMHRIIADAVAPHGEGAARFQLAGPDLPIAPKTAISLALAIHELATNAVKHGALSRPAGGVAIRWGVTGPPDDQRFTLDWTESGGPPVEAPARRGFGTRMIERGLAAELGGTARIDFALAGLRCRVEAPLPVAQP